MSTTEYKKVLDQLHRFNQRKLTKGEVTVLAYVISTEIPLMPAGLTDPKGYVTGHMIVIERVLFRLNEYAHVDSEQRKEVIELVAKFALWRYNVASGHRPIFKGNPETMVEELTGLPRLVDSGALAALADLQENANWVLNVFHDLFHYEESILNKEIEKQREGR